MSPPQVHVSIIVNAGTPLDYPQYRHTALYLHSPSGAFPPRLAHVTGPKGEFVFETRYEPKPEYSPDFARLVDVGSLSTAVSGAEEVLWILRSVAVENGNWEFDCQKWVEAALRELVERAFLRREEYESGVDGMVDAIGEARDEEE